MPHTLEDSVAEAKWVSDQVNAEREAEEALGGRRVLVTMHFPIEAMCYAAILRAVSESYPDAVIGENGTILAKEPA